MWLGTMKRKGLTIRIRDYFKIRAVLSILEVTAALVILWLEITYVGLRLSG
jgi:Na+/H+ antiporter NhaD/arsenite permease-like protein